MVKVLNIINRMRRQNRKKQEKKDIDENTARIYLSCQGIRLEDIEIDGRKDNARGYTMLRFRNLGTDITRGYNNRPLIEVGGEYYFTKPGRGIASPEERPGTPFKVSRSFNYEFMVR